MIEEQEVGRRGREDMVQFVLVWALSVSKLFAFWIESPGICVVVGERE